MRFIRKEKLIVKYKKPVINIGYSYYVAVPIEVVRKIGLFKGDSVVVVIRKDDE